jgi:hypothetical protein
MTSWDDPQPFIPSDEYDSDEDEEVDSSRHTPIALNRHLGLKMLVGRPETSLFTLNAPQRAIKGVTPLGFAAYMNDSRLVGTLLRDSGNRVAVDGMDTHGATPLMCAYTVVSSTRETNF